MTRSSLPLLLLGASLMLTGCLDGPYDPRALPYRFESHAYPYYMIPVDLDGDGLDEYLRPGPPERSSPMFFSYVLMRHSGESIDELPIVGRSAGRPLFLDVFSGPALEILIPYVRNDSLFITVFDQEGRKRSGLFLTTGAPRIEPQDGQVIPWDPRVSALRMADTDGDGKKELIAVLDTEYARLPRGVMVFSWPEGRKVGEKIVGAVTQLRVLDDVDHDGRLELVTSGYAPNNGAVAGGFSDDRSYVILFELGDSVRVDTSWSTPQTRTIALYEDLNNDGRKSLWLISTSSSQKAQRTEIREVLPHPSWRSVSRKTLNEPLSNAGQADVDHDGAPELLFYKAPNEIHVLDPDGWRHDVHPLKGRFGGLMKAIDLDGDGANEFPLFTFDGDLLVLSPDFSPIAALPLESRPSSFHPYPFHAGVGRPTYLLLSSKDGSTAYELVPNRLWWFYRYGVAALWVLGLGLVLGGAEAVRRQARRVHLLERVCTAHEHADGNGWLLLDPRGRLLRVNPAARTWLDDEPPPALTTFLEQLAHAPPLHLSRRLPLDHTAQVLHAHADPILLRGAVRPHWLVTLGTQAAHDAEAYRTWGLMARRIAHDLKNPLTSILLTLQRLQLEYQHRNPDDAVAYDAYVLRITERIEHLRQMTRNFMKFVDLNAPDLREMDLNALLTQQAPALTNRLPADVNLELKLAEDLPAVRVDAEQIRSALDNLITNALNAMPGGGLITVSTHSAHALRFPGSETPHDYVVLEVMDTGTGISAAHRARLFEPGFSTRDSTGLGLALVRKIIEDHGGHVEVESEPGAGSSFVLYFPAVSTLEAASH